MKRREESGDEREEDGGGRETHRPLRIPHESAGKWRAETEKKRDAGRDEKEQSGAESITSVCVCECVLPNQQEPLHWDAPSLPPLSLLSPSLHPQRGDLNTKAAKLLEKKLLPLSLPLCVCVCLW